MVHALAVVVVVVVVVHKTVAGTDKPEEPAPEPVRHAIEIPAEEAAGPSTGPADNLRMVCPGCW